MPEHSSKQSIGNYQLEKTLFDKGTARIYLAVHRRLGRKTFLKVYTGGDETLIQRFEREARIVADLNHPAIVQIYDFGEEEGRFYIAMEFVEGRNLQEYIRDRRLSVEEVLDLAYQIASSVAVFHEKGYIHRDLKPENILIDRQRGVKITDFGLSVHDRMTRITNEGNLLGTPLYMSPEQINNLPVSPASDVFALGVIFYFMAAGEHPFYAEHVGELFSRILSQVPVPLSRKRTDLPLWFSELVQQMLEKEPDRRPAAAGEILKAFERHQPERFTVPQAPVSGLPEPSRRKFLPMGIRLGIALAAVGLLLMVFWHYRVGKIPLPSPITDSSRQESPKIFTDSIPAPLVSGKRLSTDRVPPGGDIEPLPSPLETPPSRNLQPIQKATSPGTAAVGAGQPTTLLVQTWPWSRVYLNYQFLDVTPMLNPLEVQPGKYILSLQNPDYPSWSDTIVVYPHRANVLAFNLDTLFVRLELRVIPWGKVYIDDRFIGVTPLKKPIYLTRRDHVLRIENEFYRSYEDTLRWKGQRVIKKSVVLQELPITRRKKDL